MVFVLFLAQKQFNPKDINIVSRHLQKILERNFHSPKFHLLNYVHIFTKTNFGDILNKKKTQLFFPYKMYNKYIT